MSTAWLVCIEYRISPRASASLLPMSCSSFSRAWRSQGSSSFGVSLAWHSRKSRNGFYFVSKGVKGLASSATMISAMIPMPLCGVAGRELWPPEVSHCNHGIHISFFCDTRPGVDVVADGRDAYAAFVEDELDPILSPYALQMRCRCSAIFTAPLTPPVSSSKPNARMIVRFGVQLF
jgi:hypothetical protein